MSSWCFFVYKWIPYIKNSCPRGFICFNVPECNGSLYVTDCNVSFAIGLDLAYFQFKLSTMAFVFNLHVICQLIQWDCVCIFTRESKIFTRYKWKGKSTSSAATSVCIQYGTTRRGDHNEYFDEIFFFFKKKDFNLNELYTQDLSSPKY